MEAKNLTPHDYINAAVDVVLGDRKGYDAGNAIDHSTADLAGRLMEAFLEHMDGRDLAHDQFAYAFNICQKTARLIRMGLNWEFHTDTALDICGYGKLLSMTRLEDGD